MSTGTDSEWAAAARLVRRTGFGATGTDVDAARKLGPAAYVARVVGADPSTDPGAKRTPPPTFPAIAPAGKNAGTDAKKASRKALHEQDTKLTAWWLRRMASVDEPFGEKLTFAWHSHFATSLKKVKYAPLMLQQNQRQRSLGTGDFHTLAYTMLTDAATQRWLDNEKNTVKGPNENLSREFMEIFTLGHSDGYTETDVREGARALTGYRINPKDGAVQLRPALRDSASKTFLGRTGDLGPSQFCDAVLARPGCAPYVVTRLWSRFVSNTAPAKDVLDRLVAAYGPKRDLAALFRTMFTDPSFQAAGGTFVIGPVEWLVGAVRALKVPTDSDKQVAQFGTLLDSLGQLPLYPPSVGGWPSGPVWLSTAAADLRFRGAAMLTQHADLSTITGSTTARLETVAQLLGVAAWSPRTLSVLKGSANDPKQLVAVALNTPEYLVH
ncbi:MAG: DUF1800 domain-containing protein [Jatrophihabitans sp.]